jgi:CheY-like chemotaxis protein
MAFARILYVEDNEDNIYMLSQRLARRGYEVIVARDGAEGVAMAACRCWTAGRPRAGSSRHPGPDISR